MSIDIYGACAALRGIAADMRAGQIQIVPKQMDQQLARLHRGGLAYAVDGQRHCVVFFVGLLHLFLRYARCRSTAV